MQVYYTFLAESTGKKNLVQFLMSNSNLKKNKIRNNISTTAIKNWWIDFFLGILLVLAAVYVLLFSHSSIQFTGYLLATLILLDGIGSSLLIYTNRKFSPLSLRELVGSIISTGLGISLFVNIQDLDVSVLSFHVGLWIVSKGCLIIVSTFNFESRSLLSWKLILVLGIIILGFGLIITINPKYGTLELSIVRALSLLFTGLAKIMISLQYRSIKNSSTILRSVSEEKLEDLKESVDLYLRNNPTNIQETLNYIKEELNEALRKTEGG